jgi:hypothetical protein
MGAIMGQSIKDGYLGVCLGTLLIGGLRRTRPCPYPGPRSPGVGCLSRLN